MRTCRKIFLTAICIVLIVSGCVSSRFVFYNEYFDILRAPESIERSGNVLTLSDNAVVALQTPDSDIDLNFTVTLKRGRGFSFYLRSNVQEKVFTKGFAIDVTDDVLSCNGQRVGTLHQSTREGCDFHFTTDGAQVWLVAGSKEHGFRKYFQQKTNVTGTYRAVFAPMAESAIEVTNLAIHSTLDMKH